MAKKKHEYQGNEGAVSEIIACRRMAASRLFS